ncbi:hypothetical protein EKO27_g3263 [Xylaria grammica]|uniref:Alpha/beta hydrolase fold-3 domain-containing protein n=1 Tax=Xylaria grammica TaxID=363999 RepID=A0A439DBQ6_9PEZI|nr:hypothetical protein EKO27_g3263 [Xylaria grammica]
MGLLIFGCFGKGCGPRRGGGWYYPSTTANIPLPVLVNWHGSGFVVSFLGSNALFCSRIAQRASIIVVDVDYRKSPETPFPGAFNDVEDALLWVASQGQRFDPARIAVSGFSAGGNLALVAATKLRKKLASVLNVSAVIAMYPSTDLATSPGTRTIPKPINPAPPWLFSLFIDCYAPDKGLRKDPAISPLFADPADFPETVALITCEGDGLRPEAQELAEKLKRNSYGARKVFEYVCEGVGHGFDTNAAKGSVEYVAREKLYEVATNIVKDAFRI